MNMKKSIQLMERYMYCVECGNGLINNGEGTLVIDEDMFIRTCKCGWRVEIKEDNNMTVQYSLLILREEREELIKKKESVEKGDGSFLSVNPRRELTKIIHEIADIEFAIEVLETYED